VDVDALSQGDPLEAIGRIKASWYGTHHGQVYTEAVTDSLELSTSARRIVTMYALFNRLFWTFENGISFNQNTTGVVNPDREREDKYAVRELCAELRGNARPIISTVPPVQSTATAVPVAVAVATRTETPASTSLIKTPIAIPAVAPVLASAPSTNGSKPAVLEALGLSKTYVSDGMGFDALKNIDLKIYRGDCVAIVGKSGSGKSTLMHLLACLDGPSEGYVYVDGDDTSEMSESLKNVLRNEQFGFVFQQFFLNGRDTVYENVVLPMRIRGAGTTEIDIAAREALTAVGLADKRHKKAKDLSGGEKQRVCIARALITKPKVIFADEPTGNLDSLTGAAVEQLLFDLNGRQGITLVIVTHDSDLAAKCDRVIEMKDGQIICDTRKGDARQ
jgi:putative ABC transport system ATP-binding protein